MYKCKVNLNVESASGPSRPAIRNLLLLVRLRVRCLATVYLVPSAKYESEVDAERRRTQYNKNGTTRMWSISPASHLFTRIMNIYAYLSIYVLSQFYDFYPSLLTPHYPTFPLHQYPPC
jgi:hypothetical protein